MFNTILGREEEIKKSFIEEVTFGTVLRIEVGY